MVLVLFNGATVVLGSTLGILFRTRMNPSLEKGIREAIGLLTLVIGMSMALAVERYLALAISLIVGAAIGFGLNLEERIEGLGGWLFSRLRPGKASAESQAGFAFLQSSVLFCAGAMSITGSLEAGYSGSSALLVTKSVLDGVMAIFLTANLGPGVMLSALVILVYQGALAFTGTLVQDSMSAIMASGIQAVGGATVIAIGVSFLIRPMKTGNLLPAIPLAVLIAALDPLLPHWLQV